MPPICIHTAAGPAEQATFRPTRDGIFPPSPKLASCPSVRPSLVVRQKRKVPFWSLNEVFLHHRGRRRRVSAIHMYWPPPPPLPLLLFCPKFHRCVLWMGGLFINAGRIEGGRERFLLTNGKIVTERKVSTDFRAERPCPTKNL